MFSLGTLTMFFGVFLLTKSQSDMAQRYQAMASPSDSDAEDRGIQQGDKGDYAEGRTMYENPLAYEPPMSPMTPSMDNTSRLERVSHLSVTGQPRCTSRCGAQAAAAGKPLLRASLLCLRPLQGCMRLRAPSSCLSSAWAPKHKIHAILPLPLMLLPLVTLLLSQPPRLRSGTTASTPAMATCPPMARARTNTTR